MKREDLDIPPCDIWVDKDGLWYYRGAEIVHRDIVEHFYRHLEQDEKGRFIISWRGQRCYIDVEDTPFVVNGATFLREGEELKAILLHICDGTVEPLDPGSLYIGPGNIPYCSIHGGKFRARFSRKAYYQMVQVVEEDSQGGSYYIKLRGKKFPILVQDEEA